MKTITKTINVYSFDELSEKAKQVAIEYERNYRYRNNEFAEWAIDDCYLLEPPHKELTDLFGDDFYEVLNAYNKYKDTPLIQNTRESIYFDTDRNWFLDVSKAMVITNNDLFLKWLGIPNECIENIRFAIFTSKYRNSSTTIDFDEYDSKYDYAVQKATEKFEQHINNILRCIQSDIEYRYTDEAIIEQFENDETEFTENGDLYFH